MTPLIVGTANSEDPHDAFAELRLFENGEHVGTFLNSAVKRFRTENRPDGVPYAEGDLAVDVALHLPGLLKQGSRVELWLGGHGQQKRIFVGVIDYLTADAEKGRTTFHFQARGLAASLMDARFKGKTGDTLNALVEELTSAVGLKATIEYAETSLEAWMNVQSSYGALRLLAVNLGAIIRTDDDIVEFISGEAYLERARRRPTYKIDATDIRSSHTEQGYPVKRRT